MGRPKRIWAWSRYTIHQTRPKAPVPQLTSILGPTRQAAQALRECGLHSVVGGHTLYSRAKGFVVFFLIVKLAQ